MFFLLKACSTLGISNKQTELLTTGKKGKQTKKNKTK
jgi:hypothetical protein